MERSRSGRRRPRAKPKLKRVGVLVVLHPDGFVEVFGDHEVRVHTVDALAVHAEEEALADLYLNESLPTWARQLHWPGKLRACGQCKQISAEDELRRRHDLHMVRGLGEVRRESATIPDAIRRAREKKARHAKL